MTGRGVGRGIAVLLAAFLSVALAGCAASRSGMGGTFHGEAPATPPPGPVTVAFLFTHTDQSLGWDVIPKLHHPNRFATAFYDFFGDALPRLRNVAEYATFTDRADDVTDADRRAQRARLATGTADYTLAMRFSRQTSFRRHAAGTIVSVVTLTAVPVPYTRRYALVVDVTDRAGAHVARYERNASVTQWVQFLLVFAYPFHPETRKTQEVYMDFLHDVFRQIDAEGVLGAAGEAAP